MLYTGIPGHGGHLCCLFFVCIMWAVQDGHQSIHAEKVTENQKCLQIFFSSARTSGLPSLHSIWTSCDPHIIQLPLLCRCLLRPSVTSSTDSGHVESWQNLANGKLVDGPEGENHLYLHLYILCWGNKELVWISGLIGLDQGLPYWLMGQWMTIKGVIPTSETVCMEEMKGVLVRVQTYA